MELNNSGEYEVNLPHRFGFNFLHLNKFFPTECLLTSSNFYQLVLFWIGQMNPCKSTKLQEGPGMKDAKGAGLDTLQHGSQEYKGREP